MSKLNDVLFGSSFVFLISNIVYIGYYGIYRDSLGIIDSMNPWIYAIIFLVAAVVFISTWAYDRYERGYY